MILNTLTTNNLKRILIVSYIKVILSIIRRKRAIRSTNQQLPTSIIDTLSHI